RVERDMAAYLTRDAIEPLPLYVTTYGLAGVPEAMTGGAVRGIQAHHYLNCYAGYHASDHSSDCLKDRLTALFDANPRGMRLLIPARATPVDEAFAADLPAAFTAAASGAGRTWEDEAVFSGRDTPPLLRLVRVDPVASISGSGS